MEDLVGAISITNSGGREAAVIKNALFLVIAMIAFPVLIWALGGMFYQRCERAYPDADVLMIERCVDHLQSGGKVWEVKRT